MTHGPTPMRVVTIERQQLEAAEARLEELDRWRERKRAEIRRRRERLAAIGHPPTDDAG